MVDFTGIAGSIDLAQVGRQAQIFLIRGRSI
jgi:hypothetical protein